jgi:hypothetical protein
LNVIFVLVLAVFTICGLNVIVLGVNDVGKPSPETLSVSDVFPCASAGNVVLTVPFTGPLTVGAETTLKEHVPPDGTTVDAVTLQTGAVSPVTLTVKPVVGTGLVIVSEAAPLLVKVTLTAAELDLIV